MTEAIPFVRPRRSMLYMPGSNARMLEKARTLPTDGVIMDLEDAVAPEAKVLARNQVMAALAQGGYGQREMVVRVNGLDTPWGAADIAAVAASSADAILFPKIESAIELRTAILHLDRVADRQIAVWMMAEMPKAILALGEIASLAPRLNVIVMGTADLARAMRLPAEASRLGLLAPLSHCVLTARAWGIDILDGVFTDLRDQAGFRASCQQGLAFGFDGKSLIHPDQIQAANEIFGVSDSQAAAAQKILAAWESAATAGRGIAVVDGRMVEKLHADEARRVLTMHASITSRSGQ